MELTVYVMIRKEEKGFENYPLCVSLFGKSLKNDELCSREEGESSCDNHKLKVNANCVDGKKSKIGEDCFELIESVDINDQDQTIIFDPNHNEVLIGQVYKDKATLKSVMTPYAIRNRFQFKIKKSNGNG